MAALKGGKAINTPIRRTKMPRWMMPTAGEDAKQLSLLLLVGRQNGMATAEHSTGLSYKVKHTHKVKCNPAIPLLREWKY